MLSDVVEDYLEAIYTLQMERGPPVSTSDIAEYLGKTPSTVTSMVGKSEECGLVDHEKYKGVELTAEGETVVLEVLRYHRLLETYLTEHLDYSWSETHDKADALEHHTSEEFEKRVAATLGEFEVNPHGDPIPNTDLTLPDFSGLLTLSDCEVGDRLIVARVNNRDSAELEYPSEAGVTSGTTIEVTDIVSFGTVMVLVDDGGREQSLPESVARTIRARPPDEPSNGEVSPA